jgi:hypothetical protein
VPCGDASQRATKIKLKATAQLCAWWERGLFKYWSSQPLGAISSETRGAEEVNECISATVFFSVAFMPRRWRIENVSEIFILGTDRWDSLIKKLSHAGS